jgi:hypothetical protein
MTLTTDSFVRVRPRLFHLTSQQNVNRIRYLKCLYPAATLIEESQQLHLRHVKRIDHAPIAIDGQRVFLRDQKPFHSGAVDFESGWDEARFIGYMNEHVFFWPGRESGPVVAGMNHLGRYASENPLLLSVSSHSLIDNNGVLEPLFCRFNSGAPRTVQGRHSPRGATTYVPAREFRGTAGDVVEVVFRSHVTLPLDTEVASSYAGPWSRLFE